MAVRGLIGRGASALTALCDAAAGTLSRRRRWQLLAAVVLFYLVRDLLLYLALPALIWWRAG
jgi:hypothetical protein